MRASAISSPAPAPSNPAPPASSMHRQSPAPSHAAYQDLRRDVKRDLDAHRPGAVTSSYAMPPRVNSRDPEATTHDHSRPVDLRAR